MSDTYRIRVRAKPAASRTAVGGDHDGALVVRVGARAVDGAANEAVLGALARALGLRRRQLRLVAGARARDKLVEVAHPPTDLVARIDRLRIGG